MRAWIVVLSVLGVLVGAESAMADRRVALVMGNGNYANMPPLSNAAGDALAMGELLRKVGFDVTESIDATHQQMTAHLDAFGETAAGADIAVLYYAGQAIMVGGVSFLLPCDAELKPGKDVGLGRGIELDADRAIGGAAVRLVFLDAPRDNPFKSALGTPASKSRARIVIPPGRNAPSGSLIAYATGPGQKASDGEEGGHRPFTRALLEQIARPGVEIQEAMRQVRAQVNAITKGAQQSWGHNDLVGSVYLNPVAPDASRK